MNPDFWKNRRVLITGHTGFKGSWLSLWLLKLGARVSGYALPPPTRPGLYQLLKLNKEVNSCIADIRDPQRLARFVKSARPEIILHMAAQPLVRQSYEQPVETYETNVMGTVHLLEAARCCPSVRSVIVVTSDKCYENREWPWAYRENEPMGGKDPYSSSKGAAELVAAAYRHSFFRPDAGVGLATARAGNVIGGGDWAKDRLLPDIMQALMHGDPLRIRYPQAIRPWQLVLEPLHGYLRLAEKVAQDPAVYSDAWNFGPGEGDEHTVDWIVRRLMSRWGRNACRYQAGKATLHEAGFLKVDSSKARLHLGWRPILDLDTALDWIVQWYRVYSESRRSVRTETERQVEAFQERITSAAPGDLK